MITLLIQFIIVLVVVGQILWLLNYLPLAEPIKSIINGLVVVLVIVWLLLSLLGMARESHSHGYADVGAIRD